MNEKLQYATMLEIPVNTCSVTLKPAKKKGIWKRKFKNLEAVKEQLMNKINSESSDETISEQVVNSVENNLVINEQEEQELNENGNQMMLENTATVKVINDKSKKKFKFSVISTQFIIIALLVATIFLTNALYADSGINVFFKNVFGTTQTETVDTRSHQDFAPVIAVGEMTVITIDNGIMTFSGEGSVYSPCDGKVSAINLDENGKYSYEITHSTNFKSVISGLDYAYAGLNDNVYSNIPVGYVTESGATMCFKSGSNLVISNYNIIDGSVVWAV